MRTDNEHYSPSKRARADRMKVALLTRDDVVRMAILTLYLHQADDEKRTAQSRYLNREGFTAADAATGTELYHKLRDWSPNDLTTARRLTIKYARQLATLSDHIKRG
jgi:hypothetical protein